jgi:hypothetical protein
MAENPTPREIATERLGEPVEQWIHRQRTSVARLTYSQITRVLREEHGVEVQPQTVRNWHAMWSEADEGEPPS